LDSAEPGSDRDRELREPHPDVPWLSRNRLDRPARQEKVRVFLAAIPPTNHSGSGVL